MKGWASLMPRRGRSVTRLGVATALVLGSFLILPVAPASAAASDCNATQLCVWVNINYNGGPGRFTGSNSNWNNFPHPACPYNGTWNNCASSAVNDGTSGLGVQLWETIGYHDGVFCLPQFAQVADFTNRQFNNGHNLNDRVSANKWTSACHD